MAINVVHQPNLLNLGLALAQAAAVTEAERRQKVQLDQAQQQQNMQLAARKQDLNEREFAYGQERDAAQRQHGLDAIDRQYDRLDQRDAAQQARLPEQLAAKNKAEIELEDQRFTAQQQRQLRNLDAAELEIQQSAEWSPDQKAQAMQEIARQRATVKRQASLSALSPYPKGQREGDVWNDPATGATFTRERDGGVKLLVRPDQMATKGDPTNPDVFHKRYESLRKSLTTVDKDNNSQPPTTEQVLAAMDEQDRALAVYASRRVPAPPVEPGSTPQTMGDLRMRDQREVEFQRWYAQQAAAHGLNANPYDHRHHYDYRAAFEAGASPDENGHWPSQFKTPDHPNRYVDGIDTITGQPAANASPRGQPTPAQLRQAQIERELALVPPDHPLGTFDQTTKFPSAKSKSGFYTARALQDIALQTNTPLDTIIELLLDPPEAVKAGGKTPADAPRPRPEPFPSRSRGRELRE